MTDPPASVLTLLERFFSQIKNYEMHTQQRFAARTQRVSVKSVPARAGKQYCPFQSLGLGLILDKAREEREREREKRVNLLGQQRLGDISCKWRLSSAEKVFLAGHWTLGASWNGMMVEWAYWQLVWLPVTVSRPKGLSPQQHRETQSRGIPANGDWRQELEQSLSCCCCLSCKRVDEAKRVKSKEKVVDNERHGKRHYH